MNKKTMKLRLEQWMPIFEEQARSGMGKDEWIKANGIKRWEFYKRQRECRSYLIESAESGKEIPVNTDALPEFFELPSNLPAVVETETPVNTMSDLVCPPGHIDITCGRFNIKLDGAVDESTLKAVIKAVAHA